MLHDHTILQLPDKQSEPVHHGKTTCAKCIVWRSFGQNIVCAKICCNMIIPLLWMCCRHRHFRSAFQDGTLSTHVKLHFILFAINTWMHLMEWRFLLRLTRIQLHVIGFLRYMSLWPWNSVSTCWDQSCVLDKWYSFPNRGSKLHASQNPLESSQ